ncbi:MULTISPECIES: flagellar basal body P-ring formation chaperone FlgA [Lelliottia]|jgi:flagella basal body P-ring formation protein FlgA|uniref:Flagella basal body P-ring formation protein FlgA n=1 Tax=Lelliottia nimipressuralis TaxID=69220 RepID=A0ABD4KAD3_9ENTR|nr:MULTISPECIES: flagellar basal body P-ring formation chaperone FlgA [Lelliottia]PKA32388.1 flagellar basal body P-ring formation protein FlgA [Cedecea lapagei]MBF4178769.1 flagellar basal body P-ring formation protein FlgA [Lelliottia nimipressuralis]MCD4559165.1 flagellar basal body P-ring formation protein FlgA [Lelliottia nimipressuralis]PLY43399.1 flagellar basal body P-ring formation protein FlgA [Lelliottia sp. F159]PLY48883.1 flagellar basal body P-ring formation protein FlgA [Lelliot
MLTFKNGLAVTLLLFSTQSSALGLNVLLTAFFAERLAGLSDEVKVDIRTQPNLLPTCEQPSFSISGGARLWGNVNVLARCNNEKRFLQVMVQATGNYVVAAQPIARGSVLQPAHVELKRGRLDQLPPRTMLDINQAQDSVSLRDLAPGQAIQLSMLRQAWRIKAGQRVMVVANGDGFSINSEGQALNNAAVAQNARVRMSSGQVVSGTVGSDGNILINL